MTTRRHAPPEELLVSRLGSAQRVTDLLAAHDSTGVDSLTQQRALAPDLVAAHIRDTHAGPDADWLADLHWLAAAAEVNYQALRPRGHWRKMCALIDANGRRGRPGWRSRRAKAVAAVPELARVFRLYGGYFGRFRRNADPEGGSVWAATWRLGIGGIGFLFGAAAAATTGDASQSAQVVRLLLQSITRLPGQLWAAMRTENLFARKRRDRAPFVRRLNPPLLDNVVGTFGGAALDVGLRMSGSAQAGYLDPALAAAITGRQITDGTIAAATEISTFAPMLTAELVHLRALEIAARGEPANELDAARRRSRMLHLALDIATSDGAPSPLSVKELATHQMLVDETVGWVAKAGLRRARAHTAAFPQRTPVIKRRVPRWMVLPLLSVGVAAAAAAAFGNVAFVMFALPGLATALGVQLTMAAFHRHRHVEESDRAEKVSATDDSDEVRSAVRRRLHSGARSPFAATWRPRRERAKLWPELWQAAKVAPFPTAAAVASLAVEAMAPYFWGQLVSVVAGHFTTALSYSLWNQHIEARRYLAAAEETRQDAEKLALVLGVEPAGWRTEFAAVDRQLREAITISQRHISHREHLPTEVADSANASRAYRQRGTTRHEHERDVGALAVAELVDEAMAPRLDPSERLTSICGEPSLHNPNHVQLARTLAESPLLRKPSGRFRRDLRLVAYAWQLAHDEASADVGEGPTVAERMAERLPVVSQRLVRQVSRVGRGGLVRQADRRAGARRGVADGGPGRRRRHRVAS